MAISHLESARKEIMSNTLKKMRTYGKFIEIYANNDCEHYIPILNYTTYFFVCQSQFF